MQAVNRYVFAPTSFHPCVKLGTEQSWHHFKIRKWPITNYVQTQFSVISSNISMIIMYYEYMTTQCFVRYFFIHLKPRVESFWVVLVVHRNESVLKNIFKRGYEEIRNIKLPEILKKDRTWLKYELHCNVKTPFFPK